MATWSPSAVIHHLRMLRYAPMAGLVKLHRNILAAGG
ncbi:hypothetical protein SULPSESMR1_04398 (plasmid) [Pseudosulfitobacter pseudonitzschiae]|uniref:Uncharacterized protein n=1 Tax=Pseudosulfitobacter pseudonitzschiae TaxID=1402135 RepID=A0A221K7Z1_9RHOB|nr:hypothetical protein SULPSESMR1_04398 [Pseudosulfitobacter pseudonitzschiae]